MPRIARLSMLAAIVNAATAGTVIAAEAPYLGAWDCGVATFWFTPNGYDNGSTVLPVKSVRKEQGGYLLSFADGYVIALSSITRTSMSWYSRASGDQFECRRLR